MSHAATSSPPALTIARADAIAPCSEIDRSWLLPGTEEQLSSGRVGQQVGVLKVGVQVREPLDDTAIACHASLAVVTVRR